MCDTNAVEISGTIAEEPVYRTTKNNQGMSTFCIKVQRQEPSKAKDFLNVVAWGEQANLVRESYHEGERIGVKGHLRKQYYIGQDGTKRYNLQIVAEDIYQPKS
ncbi:MULTISPECIES: single-stranded DNA-binding protein [Terrabacteria group]|uniref:single-stranded DNA-binding protein n=1 Tax=Bacillati TaxID=1783272 RepID=UPI00193A3784|nr:MULTISPECIES: single-stranded DNA-binding protein [Terrabacteria group]MBW9212677.1 single-stranded DNA-binding protein [Trueperella sp. zg.1013]QRG86837.1 single-stranded DNA-binding protein [Bulleidia sp. zg-1006]